MNARWIAGALVALALAVPVQAAAADEAPAPDTSHYLIPDLPPVPAVPAPVDYAAVIRYMRGLPPDVLIRIAFADTPVTERMLAIARRESGLGRHTPVPFDPACSAKNPHSSATGLFQTLSGWNGTAVAFNLSWANVAGPDCLDDVLLARAIYARSGLHPWRA